MSSTPHVSPASPHPPRPRLAPSTLVGMSDASERPISGYSKGMRQRTKVAAGLVHDPQILILDEPLNGTDPIQRARLITLFQRLAAEGRTVIVSSHVLQEVERMTDRVIAMVDGKLAAAGHIAAIRRSMTDIPYRVLIESDRPVELAAAMLATDAIAGVQIGDHQLEVETTDVERLGLPRPRSLSRDIGARITAFRPEDESAGKCLPVPGATTMNASLAIIVATLRSMLGVKRLILFGGLAAFPGLILFISTGNEPQSAALTNLIDGAGFLFSVGVPVHRADSVGGGARRGASRPDTVICRPTTVVACQHRRIEAGLPQS